MGSIHDYFQGNSVDAMGLAAFLDSLSNDARIAAIRSLKPAEQKALWDAVEANKLTLTHFVPADVPDLTEVIHYGYNNQIPGFRIFEKRFARPSQGGDKQLVGYNQYFLMGLFGPGYFVARPDQFGSVVVDYYLTPTEKPAAWPPIRPNSGLLPGLVYGNMHDHMRGVSKHVSIGRAVKNGKITNNFFVLCRQD